MLQVVDEIVAAGGKAVFHTMDMTKPETIKALMDDTAKDLGRIDVLVNNASNVMLPDGTVEELTLEMWDDIFTSDLRGTFYAIKCALPYMRAQKKGSIVNIGSCASANGDVGAAAYGCAKAGINSLTEYTAMQYGKDNIRCNCIRPGLIVTPQNAAMLPDYFMNIFMDNSMVNRVGCPEDIGHLAVFLGSDESEFVTAQIINVDGGTNSHATTTAQFRALGKRTMG